MIWIIISEIIICLYAKSSKLIHLLSICFKVELNGAAFSPRQQASNKDYTTYW